jgi:hypothetical protein
MECSFHDFAAGLTGDAPADVQRRIRYTSPGDLTSRLVDGVISVSARWTPLLQSGDPGEIIRESGETGSPRPQARGRTIDVFVAVSM